MAGLQEVFNQILLGKELEMLFNSKEEYDSLRTSLVRKLKKASEGMELIGDYNPYRTQFVKATWNSANNIGTFSLQDKSKKIRKSYDIKNL